jgi:uncharacterized membrane protein YidH (DUF202 family)
LSSPSTSKAPSSGTSPGSQASRRPLSIILTIIGVLAIIAGILYVSGAANSIHALVGSVHKGNHAVRAAVSFIVGVVCLAVAYVARARPAPGSGT